MPYKRESVRTGNPFVVIGDGDKEVSDPTEKINEETPLEKLEEKVTSLEMALDSIVGQLNLKVDSDSVIAAINISPEDIRIKGSAIHLDDAVVVEVDGKKIANSLYRKTRLKR